MNGGPGAVFRAAAGGLGGRKLQAVIIGLVVLAATAASTLALGMLADAHSPFDHAFAQQKGANVAVTVDTSAASAAQIAAATRVEGVTAVAGPYCPRWCPAHRIAADQIIIPNGPALRLGRYGRAKPGPFRAHAPMPGCRQAP
jgi:hypothetical protein